MSAPIAADDQDDAEDPLLEFMAEDEAEQMIEEIGHDPEVDAGLLELRKLRESRFPLMFAALTKSAQIQPRKMTTMMTMMRRTFLTAMTRTTSLMVN